MDSLRAPQLAEAGPAGLCLLAGLPEAARPAALLQQPSAAGGQQAVGPPCRCSKQQCGMGKRCLALRPRKCRGGLLHMVSCCDVAIRWMRPIKLVAE